MQIIKPTISQKAVILSSLLTVFNTCMFYCLTIAFWQLSNTRYVMLCSLSRLSAQMCQLAGVPIMSGVFNQSARLMHLTRSQGLKGQAQSPQTAHLHQSGIGEHCKLPSRVWASCSWVLPAFLVLWMVILFTNISFILIFKWICCTDVPVYSLKCN